MKKKNRADKLRKRAARAVGGAAVTDATLDTMAPLVTPNVSSQPGAFTALGREHRNYSTSAAIPVHLTTPHVSLVGPHVECYLKEPEVVGRRTFPPPHTPPVFVLAVWQR